VVQELVFITGTNPRARVSYWWHTGGRGCLLGPTVGGIGGVRATWGFEGGKVIRGGSKGFGSTGCRAAIVSHIHRFFTVRGGVG